MLSKKYYMTILIILSAVILFGAIHIINIHKSINNILTFHLSRVHIEVEEIYDELCDKKMSSLEIEQHFDNLSFNVKAICSLEIEDYDLTSLRFYLDDINEKIESGGLSDSEMMDIKRTMELIHNEFVKVQWATTPGLGAPGYYNFFSDNKKIVDVVLQINSISS